MPEALAEQRNAYRGEPSRAWLRVEFIAPSGGRRAVDLLVDTGNPYEVIIDAATMQAMQWHAADQSESNFGIAEGGWLQIAIADIGFDAFIVGYANDRIVGIVKRPDWGFDGLIGLPLLRMLEYGGDRGFFWVRKSDSPRS